MFQNADLILSDLAFVFPTTQYTTVTALLPQSIQDSKAKTGELFFGNFMEKVRVKMYIKKEE